MALEDFVSPGAIARLRRYMMPGLATGHATFHWILQSFAVVLPEIQMFFGLNAVGAAGVMSARDLASGIIALPGGVVVDIVRRHWDFLLAGCLALAALGSLLMGVSPVYWLLLIGIGVVAISHSVWHLPASASLSHHFAERRGTALAVHGVGGSVGDVVGPLATGGLLAYMGYLGWKDGWKYLLSIYAIAPFILGFVALWAFRHIGRVDSGSGAPADPPTMARRLELTRQLLRSPVLWGLTFVRGLRSMCLISLVTVLPLYLADELGMNTAWRGFHIALLIVVGLVAKSGAGYLSDRYGRKQVLVPGAAVVVPGYPGPDSLQRRHSLDGCHSAARPVPVPGPAHPDRGGIRRGGARGCFNRTRRGGLHRVSDGSGLSLGGGRDLRNDGFFRDNDLRSRSIRAGGGGVCNPAVVSPGD